MSEALHGTGPYAALDAIQDMGEHAPGSPHAMLSAVLDDMIARFGRGAYEAQVAAARSEYDEQRGRVFEDEELWESWTQTFLEWYVVERPLADADGEGGARLVRPPVVRAAGEARAAGDTRRERAAMALLTSHRSLFEVRGLRAGRVELVDLLGGGQFSVVERRNMAGVSAGDVAEMRLLGFEGEVLFGRTFCFHPPGTRDAIAAHARRIRARGGARGDVLDHCASLRIRCERYRHVPAARIYEAVDAGVAGPAAGPR